MDGETGTSYNYHRDYDPSLGRYIQSDPLGLYDGPSTYGYVQQNPLSYVDPYGLETAPNDLFDPPNLFTGGGGFRPGIQEIAGAVIAASLINLASQSCPPKGWRKDVTPHHIPQPVVTTPHGPGNDDDDGEEDGPFANSKEADNYAKDMGFSRTNYRAHGQRVYKRGNEYITRDVDGHNGGAWKRATGDWTKLQSRSTRSGTYNRSLTTRIGD